MEMRTGLLFLFLLNAAGSTAGIQMAAITSDISALQIKKQEQELQYSNNVTRNDEVCTLCEEFATQAIDYLAENKIQTEILEILHRTCSRITAFEQECITLVDYYSSIFFSYVSSVHSEDFCLKFNLCREMKILSSEHHENSCRICQHAVSELLIKLKDPNTQLEIIELLLKACNSMENYAQKCKRMVFEYGPLVLANSEQFLETRDVCTMIHACKVPTDRIEQASRVVKADS